MNLSGSRRSNEAQLEEDEKTRTHILTAKLDGITHSRTHKPIKRFSWTMFAILIAYYMSEKRRKSRLNCDDRKNSMPTAKRSVYFHYYHFFPFKFLLAFSEQFIMAFGYRPYRWWFSDQIRIRVLLLNVCTRNLLRTKQTLLNKREEATFANETYSIWYNRTWIHLNVSFSFLRRCSKRYVWLARSGNGDFYEKDIVA